MIINLNNYEAYFLDYHEGSLSPALVKELMEFIAQNPELKDEFESFQEVTLNDTEGIKFSDKESLKKSALGINAANFEEYAVAHVEGSLSPLLEKELMTFIAQDPGYKKDLELFSKTKLVPDTTIVFEHKHVLKRNYKRPAAFYYWSAAASVAIIVASYFLLHKNATPDGTTITKNNHSTDSGIVAKQPVKSGDTGNIAHSVVTTNSVNTVATNNQVAALPNTAKNPRNNNPAVRNSNNSSQIFVVRQASKMHILPSQSQWTLPAEDIASGDTLNNETKPVADWMTKYESFSNAEKEFASQEPDKEIITEKKRNKFFYVIAKFTCKGLHKITGQHINFEKRYDSDTTNIIAYQLDLGNKKINFPVKD